MNRREYLADRSVQAFLAWCTPFVGGERLFRHRWTSRRHGDFECSSVFDGYLRYRWRFRVKIPGERVARTGHTFDESFAALEALRALLREAASAQDVESFRDAALAVLEWGGVTPKNAAWLTSRSSTQLREVIDATGALDPATVDTSRLRNVPRMNSGFTKIYALLIDGYPIYDSRVAATLGSFIRAFCVDSGLMRVPPSLTLAIPPGRSGGRDTRDRSPIRLPRIAGDEARRTRQHVESNVRAAWLLSQQADCGPFGQLGQHRRLRALEAAFFMIGYEPPTAKAFLSSD